MKRKIAIFGGTGLIGKSIISSKIFEDYHFKVFSRDLNSARKIISDNADAEIVPTDSSPEKYTEILEDCEILLNFAGASIGGKRWNKRYKQILYDSRINTTRKIISALSIRKSQLRTFINASAIGIYGNKKEEIINEDSSKGNDFLAKLCSDWEREAGFIRDNDIRTVILRMGVILSRKGGALEKMLLPYRFYAGGYLGKGNQWISWLHIDELISIIQYIIENERISGPVNCTSPNPIRNKEFNAILGNILKKPSYLAVPSFLLKLVLGEFSDTVLFSQRVIPQKLLKEGYSFEYDLPDKALLNLLS